MPRHVRFALAAVGLAALFAATLPAQSSAPSPADSFGFAPCADYQLATYEATEAYFRSLAARAGGRMRLVDIGRTVQGRTEIMAVISSAANLAEIDRFQRISAALATAEDQDGAVLSDSRARELARAGKAVVWIDFGLHSTEVAPAQAAPILAYRAVTGESPEMRFIRDNVVLLLVPNMNPDGTTIVADWYRTERGHPWESTPPDLWHVYAGHDNNRDWYMMTQPETRNAARQLYQEWFPQIVYDHHQSGPFPARIFVPPFEDPVNPNIPPLVMRGVDAAGAAIARRLEREGKGGAISHIGFDAWWNGGMRTAPYFHNMIGILTETSHASATPAVYDPREFPDAFANGVSTREPSTSYPTPFEGGEWHLRDSCDYILTASTAVLDLAARRREEWLYDIFRMGRAAIDAHRDETYLVPAEQWDAGAAARLVEALRMGGVRIARARTAFEAGGRRYGAGTFVIPGGQPFAPYVRDLLTGQAYPDVRLYPDGPPKRPYDITGWTLPYQMGVRVDHLAMAVAADTEPVRGPAAGARDVAWTGAAGVVALDPRANDAFTIVNRLLAAGRPVYRSTAPVEILETSDTPWPPGTFLVPLDATSAAIIEAGTASLAVPFARPVLPTAAGGAALWRVRRPRIGVYHGWGGNTDEGWTRWVLEQFEFAPSPVLDARIREGHLRARYDTIVLPDATAAQMIDGLRPGSMPPAYTGGMTEAGVAHLRAFVESGGTLVALDRAAELAIPALGLPVADVTSRARPSEFFAPGTILRLSVDPSDPVAFGMPGGSAAFFAHSPAFEVDGAARVAARYPGRDLLLSGWLLGESTLAGRAAVVTVPVGAGRAVLLGFRTEHRGQAHGTFKLLFNALLLGASEPAPADAVIEPPVARRSGERPGD